MKSSFRQGKSFNLSQMSKILITGATGNVGKELVKICARENVETVAALTDLTKSSGQFPSGIEPREFDFTRPETYADAMRGVSKVFLMRPPAVSNVRRDIYPFLEYCRRERIEQIVFLSLLGAEKLSFTPHRKIELEILRLDIPYTFLRPSFFMQNLTATHREEIKNGNEIFVPAGLGKTSFIDARDVAFAAFLSLSDAQHLNKSYELTGSEALSYYEVAEILSDVLKKPIVYPNPSLLSFIWRNRRKHKNLSFVLVMEIIYTTARFGQAGLITEELPKLLGRKPISFRQFAEDYKDCWN